MSAFRSLQGHRSTRTHLGRGQVTPVPPLTMRAELGNPDEFGDYKTVFVFYSEPVVVSKRPPFRLFDAPYELLSWAIIDAATVRFIYDADLRGVKWRYDGSFPNVRDRFSSLCNQNAGTFPE